MRSVGKRIIGTIPVLIGVVLLIFIMLRIIPGSPAAMLLGEHVDQATIDRLTEAMGLNEPLPNQFFKYIIDALHGDLGISYKYDRPVTEMILEAFPYTVVLALMAAVFAWVLGLLTGIAAAVRQNSLVDRLFMGVSLMGVSMPIFMTSLLLQYLLAFKVKVFPLTLDGSFLSMILPAIALGWNSAGSVARMTRSSLLEVMQADYIDTARAKGLANGAVILGHALKNSMLPVITMMALQFSSMLSGAVITESIFAIPGIGRLATSAIQNRDMPVLQGTVLFTTVLVIAGNLAADLLYSVMDPRIRKEA
ncbi:MAG: ABC transporter permease [Gemmiger sp.]|uniref:ABC transporter permease n=1 Tax=Gemmiger sp. TaxID=2049027 RepID=UPI002E79E226|nr:ABC transporter permease [Gemmiger sp.]MEE0800172.1 ABC transporter permease [Gemmiger sp.]